MNYLINIKPVSDLNEKHTDRLGVIAEKFAKLVKKAQRVDK